MSDGTVTALVVDGPKAGETITTDRDQWIAPSGGLDRNGLPGQVIYDRYTLKVEDPYRLSAQHYVVVINWTYVVPEGVQLYDVWATRQPRVDTLTQEYWAQVDR